MKLAYDPKAMVRLLRLAGNSYSRLDAALREARGGSPSPYVKEEDVRSIIIKHNRQRHGESDVCNAIAAGSN